jgi:ankyrin repeat protein
LHRKGWTMLHWAATTNLVEVAKMLLKHGADANAQVGFTCAAAALQRQLAAAAQSCANR